MLSFAVAVAAAAAVEGLTVVIMQSLVGIHHRMMHAGKLKPLENQEAHHGDSIVQALGLLQHQSQKSSEHDEVSNKAKDIDWGSVTDEMLWSDSAGQAPEKQRRLA